MANLLATNSWAGHLGVLMALPELAAPTVRLRLGVLKTALKAGATPAWMMGVARRSAQGMKWEISVHPAMDADLADLVAANSQTVARDSAVVLRLQTRFWKNSTRIKMGG